MFGNEGSEGRGAEQAEYPRSDHSRESNDRGEPTVSLRSRQIFRRKQAHHEGNGQLWQRATLQVSRQWSTEGASQVFGDKHSECRGIDETEGPGSNHNRARSGQGEPAA